MKNKILLIVFALILCFSLLALNVSAFSGYHSNGDAYIPTYYELYSPDEPYYQELYITSGTEAVEGTSYEEYTMGDEPIYADVFGYTELQLNTLIYTYGYQFSQYFESVTLHYPDIYLSDLTNASSIIGGSVQLFDYAGDLLRPGYTITGDYVILEGDNYIYQPFENVSIADSEGYVFVSWASDNLPDGCVGVVNVEVTITDVSFYGLYCNSTLFGGSRWSLSPKDIVVIDNSIVNPDIFAWLSSSVQGFLDIPIFAENITFGSLLILLVSVPLTIAFLKFFAGG